MGAAAKFKNTYWLRCGLMPHLQRGLTPRSWNVTREKTYKVIGVFEFQANFGLL